MKEKKQKTEAEKLQERLEDVEALVTATQILENERKELTGKDSKAKQLYKNAWKEQMKMKTGEIQVDKVFKN